MYKYKKRNPFSTQSSPVYDEGNRHIVDIQKVFRNPFQRIVSIVTLSLRFRRYELRNSAGEIVIEASAKSVLEGKHFELYYHDNGSTQKVLFDKKSSGTKDTYGIIKLDNRILNIYADENNQTHIKDAKLDRDIAYWKQVGDYAEIRGGEDRFFEDHKILCIAILHIFAVNHFYTRHKGWSMIGPPTI